MKTENLNNLAEKVIKTIEEKNIKPRPKWEFVLKNYFIWTVAVLALIIGSLAFAIIIYLIKSSDWELYQQINDGWLKFIILSLPYFWLFIFIALILLAYYNFKHTKKGYKYHLHLIVIITFILSLTGGSLFYTFGLGQYIDNIFEQQIPIYRQLMAHRYKVWQHPENGLLAGRIEKIISSNIFTLRDLNNKYWTVIHLTSQPVFEIKPELRIKMVGQIIDLNTFQAEIIKPLWPMRKGMGWRTRHLINERKK